MLTATFQTLHDFGGPGDGDNPLAGLTSNGSTLYGTTTGGDGGNYYDDGTVFSMNTDGSGYQILHVFTLTDPPSDGAQPDAGLTLAGSTLYGTTPIGGSTPGGDGEGTVFSINTDGSGYQVLYSFGSSGDSDGEDPEAGLTLAGSTLYGTTASGGAYGGGTVFSINTDGSDYQVLYSFGSGDADGVEPRAGLTLVGSTLFGTTDSGGTGGTVFSINTDGSDYQVLHSFSGADSTGDGAFPQAGLTLAGSTLYGTTSQGGADSAGTVFSINTDGSDYQVLYSFGSSGDADGEAPITGLTLAGSTLYGTTGAGGSGGQGTVFAINTDGSGYQLVRSFSDSDLADGVQPNGLTLVGSNLFGTTEMGGGTYEAGTVFSITGTPPSVTAGGATASYTVNGTAATVDPNVKVTSGTDADITGAAVVLTNPNPTGGDTLNFSSQNGITETSYTGGTLTLGGNATVANYQTALQGITFSSTNTTTPSTTPRLITMTADDTAASPSVSDTVTDTVDVTIPQPSVTAGASAAQYTAGSNAVTVDGGIKVNSVDTGHMTSATMAITTNLQSGDTLNFSSQNGITETSYTSGTLTLGGTASTSAYQTALQSVTFNSSSTSVATRSITLQVDDSFATPSTSATAADTVDVYAPATVTALYVKGSAWTTTATGFDSYLGAHTLGNASTPTLGWALQTGATQSKDLPWVNMNVIEATFSEAVNVAKGSLILTGSSQSGYSTPSVTGFSSLGGNTYAWTLSTSLSANRLEISFLSTGGNAVTDVRGAGLSGNWTNGTSTFPSGDGLAGTTSGPNTPTSSDFNFLFNVVPGDSARNGSAPNTTSYLDVKNKVGNSDLSAAYVPYYDVAGVGAINTTSYLDVKNKVGTSQSSTSFAPGPQDSGVGGLTTTGDDADLSGEMLAVQEGSTSQTGGLATPTASNQTSGGTTSTSSSTGGSSSSSAGSLASDTDATDAAVTDFDLADLYA